MAQKLRMEKMEKIQKTAVI